MRLRRSSPARAERARGQNVRRLAGHSLGGARPARWRRPCASAVGVGALALVAALLAGCATARPRPEHPGGVERGVASWYGPDFHGRFTASGERYDMEALTAAHRTLAFGTVVAVHNLDNGRRVEVRINDRGPFRKSRVIDLSRRAASEIGMIGPGTAEVELVVVRLPPVAPPPRWTVQVGAFHERQRAEALADALRAEYPAVELRAFEDWNRVQVGEFNERRRAEALRRELAAAGYPALVVDRR